MMSVEQQAKALADWLAENPGVEPPEGVDSDVIEAVYSLRPDLAPAPRVSVDDILGLVSAGPLAAPAVPVVGVEPVIATEPVVVAEPVVSTVPTAVTTPTPANNNRRLWAVLGGVAALAAAVLVTVQVTMTAGSPTFDGVASAPMEAPALAQGPSTNAPPGAARQLNQVDAVTGAIERSSAADSDGLLDAVADVGELPEGEEQFNFQFDDDADLSGDFRNEFQRQGIGSLDNGEEGSGSLPIEPADPNMDTGLEPTVAQTTTRGSFGGEADEVGADGWMEEVAAGPAPRPVALATPAPEPVRPVVTAAAAPPPPPAAAPDVLDVYNTDDLLSAGIADAEEDQELEWDDAPETLSVDDESVVSIMPARELAETSVVGGRNRGRSRDERRAQRAERAAQSQAAPPSEAEMAAEVPQQPVVEAEPVPDPSPFAGAVDAGAVDAGVVQAQERARAFADRQQYSSAFDTLSGFMSPSAPIDVVLEATEYAFAAGRWSDTVRVASIRLNANVPSDSAQSRSRLYDFRARAQAMLDERTSAPTMMSDEP